MSTFEIAISDEQIQQIEEILNACDRSFDDVVRAAIALYLEERGSGR